MNDEETPNPTRAAIVLVAIIIGVTLPATLNYFVAALGIAAHGFLWVLDCMMGAHILGLQPWASWAILGGALGASLALWTVAPAIGRKDLRSMLGFLPFAILLLLMIVDMGVSISFAGAQPAPATPAPATARARTSA